MYHFSQHNMEFLIVLPIKLNTTYSELIAEYSSLNEKLDFTTFFRHNSNRDGSNEQFVPKFKQHFKLFFFHVGPSASLCLLRRMLPSRYSNPSRNRALTAQYWFYSMYLCFTKSLICIKHVPSTWRGSAGQPPDRWSDDFLKVNQDVGEWTWLTTILFVEAYVQQWSSIS